MKLQCATFPKNDRYNKEKKTEQDKISNFNKEYPDLLQYFVAEAWDRIQDNDFILSFNGKKTLQSIECGENLGRGLLGLLAGKVLSCPSWK